MNGTSAKKAPTVSRRRIAKGMSYASECFAPQLAAHRRRSVLVASQAASKNEWNDGEGNCGECSPGHPESVTILDSDADVGRNGIPGLVNGGSPDRSSNSKASRSSESLQGGKGKAKAVCEEFGEEGKAGEDGSGEDDDVSHAGEEAEVAFIGEDPTANDALKLRNVVGRSVFLERSHRLPSVTKVSVRAVAVFVNACSRTHACACQWFLSQPEASFPEGHDPVSPAKKEDSLYMPQ